MPSIEEKIKSFAKRYGPEHAALGAKMRDIERAPTGIFQFDLASGGGFPRGKISTVYGKESCLAPHSQIKYHVRSKDGKIHNAKGGSIERLWYRFHGLPVSGKGGYKRKQTRNSVFTVPCINEQGVIQHAEVMDVIRCGMKQVFELRTKKGFCIKATPEHRFWNGQEFVCLSGLDIGDTIFVHNNTPNKGRQRYLSRPEIVVKYHPYAPLKTIAGCDYKRLSISRFVYEAALNNLEVEEYRWRLNEGKLEGLVFSDPNKHIHHLDENCLNDVSNNLVEIDPVKHGKLHVDQNKLGFIAIPDVVESIIQGLEVMTYDIKMAGVYRNYVADGFVVHNSGKTNLALKTMGLLQAAEPDSKAVFIDVEHSLDPAWAARLGVDTEQLVVFEPDFGEEAIDMLDAAIRSDDVSIIVLDSLAALTTEKEIDNESTKQQVAGNSLLVGKAMRKAVSGLSAASKEDCFPTVILINQIRTKVGVVYGSPDYQPGGNALRHTSGLTVKIYGKNEMDKSFSQVIPAYKDTSVVIEKWKVPIVQINCEYKMAMVDTDDLVAGAVEEWNTVSHYLRESGKLKKLGTGGWLVMGKECKKLEEAKHWVMDYPERLEKAKADIIEHELARLKKGA